MSDDNKVYDALSTLRKMKDEFAVFEHNADDKTRKKTYSRCRKQIAEIVESLERTVLRDKGKHGSLTMGIYTGGPINTTTSMSDIDRHDQISPKDL